MSKRQVVVLRLGKSILRLLWGRYLSRTAWRNQSFMEWNQNHTMHGVRSANVYDFLQWRSEAQNWELKSQLWEWPGIVVSSAGPSVVQRGLWGSALSTRASWSVWPQSVSCTGLMSTSGKNKVKPKEGRYWRPHWGQRTWTTGAVAELEGDCE